MCVEHVYAINGEKPAMIHTVPRHESEKVRTLFQGPHLRLVIDAVVAGNSPGTIWVDNRADPQTALMWDHAHCYYLAGAADNTELNQELARLVSERLRPEAVGRDRRVFKVYYTSEDWQSQIEVIFENTSLTKMERVFYAFERLNIPDWKDRTPAGFRVERIDKAILADKDLMNVHAVLDEIGSCWNSLEDYLQNGFGYCLLYADEIVCWCTAEYVSAQKCGIGIETVEAYTGRGFATLTACAFVEHCISHRITPHWDSWKANLPSVAVAEKVGFWKTLDYAVYLGRFDSARPA